MEPLTALHTAHLFPDLHAELMALLRAREASDWERPTLAGSWRVRDIVGHLLDIDLRKLAGVRDGHRLPNRPASPAFADVVTFINDLNATGVMFAERLSPRLMTDLLYVTGPWVSELVASLPPDEDAHISVLWAGEETSKNWMDTGREYTERWHHQMQIRDAVGAPGLLERRWFHPILDLSVRAFPRAYTDVVAATGTAVVFEVDSEPDTVWSLIREESSWVVCRGGASDAVATLRTDGDTAWKLLYNALPAEAARDRVTITGDPTLVEPIFRARSVMV